LKAFLNRKYRKDGKPGEKKARVFSVFPGKSLYLQYRFC